MPWRQGVFGEALEDLIGPCLGPAISYVTNILSFSAGLSKSARGSGQRSILLQRCRIRSMMASHSAINSLHGTWGQEQALPAPKGELSIHRHGWKKDVRDSCRGASSLAAVTVRCSSAHSLAVRLHAITSAVPSCPIRQSQPGRDTHPLTGCACWRQLSHNALAVYAD